MKQAIAKTITYRIIVTTLDFSVNYVVLGELATAAGLSAFAWSWARYFIWLTRRRGIIWTFPIKRARPYGRPAAVAESKEALAARGGFTISRALAKTITFRTIATTMDFTTNFVVVGDLATAVLLSASGFILGPFVYLGHEMAWDHFGSPSNLSLSCRRRQVCCLRRLRLPQPTAGSAHGPNSPSCRDDLVHPGGLTRV